MGDGGNCPTQAGRLWKRAWVIWAGNSRVYEGPSDALSLCKELRPKEEQ